MKNCRVSGDIRNRVKHEDEIQQRRTTNWNTWRGPTDFNCEILSFSLDFESEAQMSSVSAERF